MSLFVELRYVFNQVSHIDSVGQVHMLEACLLVRWLPWGDDEKLENLVKQMLSEETVISHLETISKEPHRFLNPRIIFGQVRVGEKGKGLCFRTSRREFQISLGSQENVSA